MERFDIGIVGAGPAGSSAAISLARRGYSVLLVDKRRFPRPKLCGDFLNPINWPLLGRLGVADAILATEHEKVTAFRISSASGEEAVFRFPRHNGESPFGLGLSRARLDHLLLEEAVKAGATVLQGARIKGLEREESGWSMTLDNGSEVETLGSAFLIGADGRNSWVAKRLGRVDPGESRGRVVGFQLHLDGTRTRTGEVQIHIFPGGYAGLVDLGAGRTNLCFTVERGLLKNEGSVAGTIAHGLSRNPHLNGILRSCRISHVASAYPVYFPPRRSFGDRFLLAGDAARVSEPVTGDGVYFALRSGELAAEAVHAAFVAGDATARRLAQYARGCRQCFSWRQRANAIIRALVYRPSLIRPAIRLSSMTSIPLGPAVKLLVGTRPPAL